MQYRAIVCILVLPDVNVNTCIKKAVKILFMKRFVNIFPMSLFCFFNFLLNDAIDFLMNTEDNSDIESSSDEDNHYLALLPPIEKVSALTDMESDATDDVNNGPVHQLPRRLLNSTCDSSLFDIGKKQKFVKRTQPPNKKSRKPATINWKKDTDLQPSLKLSKASTVPEE